jgi:hypothetical protein
LNDEQPAAGGHPLALAAAISPVIFLLQLNALTGDRPIARGAALTAGAAIVLIVVSTIGVLVGDTGFSANDTLKAAINIGFGVLLVAVGLRAGAASQAEGAHDRPGTSQHRPLPGRRGWHGVEPHDMNTVLMNAVGTQQPQRPAQPRRRSRGTRDGQASGRRKVE